MDTDKNRAVIDLGFDDELVTPKPAPKIDPEAIKKVSRNAGFGETPKSAMVAKTAKQKSKRQPKPEIEAEPVLKKRGTRQKTGRVYQFATRIDVATNNRLYNYAEDHGITLGETLERASKALLGVEF